MQSLIIIGNREDLRLAAGAFGRFVAQPPPSHYPPWQREAHRRFGLLVSRMSEDLSDVPSPPPEVFAMRICTEDGRVVSGGWSANIAAPGMLERCEYFTPDSPCGITPGQVHELADAWTLLTSWFALSSIGDEWMCRSYGLFQTLGAELRARRFFPWITNRVHAVLNELIDAAPTRRRWPDGFADRFRCMLRGQRDVSNAAAARHARLPHVTSAGRHEPVYGRSLPSLPLP